MYTWNSEATLEMLTLDTGARERPEEGSGTAEEARGRNYFSFNGVPLPYWGCVLVFRTHSVGGPYLRKDVRLNHAVWYLLFSRRLTYFVC